MKTITHVLLALLISIMLFSGCKAEQRPVATMATQTAVLDIPDWQKSYNEVIASLANCAKLQEADVCKSTHYYELGYLFENMEDSLIEGSLDSAEYYYKASLALFPKDRTVRDRLVFIHISQGQLAEAQALQESLYEEFPESRPIYALQLSKNLYQQKKYEKSLEWAKRCTELNPYLEDGWKNLIISMEKLPMTFNEIDALAFKAFNYGFINQGLQILEMYINHHYKNEPLKVPVIHWCNILFDSQSDYNSRFQKIPDYEEWPNRGVMQLRKLFELNAKEKIELQDLKQLDFWYNHERTESPNGNIYNYEILLKFLDQSARIMMNSNRLAAVSRYELGIEMIRDLSIQSYELTGTYFGFVSSLADLYLIYPELDPDNRKINRLTENLFSGKGDAYGDNNREIIKQFHITLGMIYSQQGKWTGGWATNARFQMEHALDNMEEDESMPLINELLANGYLHFLNNKERAMDQYLAAAEGYLNLDAVFNARKSLDSLQKYQVGLQGSAKEKMNGLEAVYDIRVKGRDANFDINAERAMEFVENQVAGIQGLNLSEEFKNIHIFKIYAETGQKLPLREQLICYSRAMNMIKKMSFLPSYNDLVKIERMARAMQNQIKTSTASFTQISKNVASDQPARGIMLTFNPATESKIAIFIDPSLYEVQNIIVHFIENRNLSDSKEISYYNQQVIISENNNEVLENMLKDGTYKNKGNLKIRQNY